MASLLKVRDTVALHGRIELNQLCREVNGSPAMVLAMLERLEQMGCVEKVEDIDNGCVSAAAKDALRRVRTVRRWYTRRRESTDYCLQCGFRCKVSHAQNATIYMNTVQASEQGDSR